MRTVDTKLLLIRKFSSDFYFANFVFPIYLRGLEFANEFYCSLSGLYRFIFARTLISRGNQPTNICEN